MKKFLKEFKEFISRGNVMDMAVGIIIGGAFTSIVSSLVSDIINPILGLFGGMNFDQLKITLLGEATLYYGRFITAVINFLIMALVIFVIIKAMNTAATRFHHKEKEEEKRACPCDCSWAFAGGLSCCGGRHCQRVTDRSRRTHGNRKSF